MNEIYLMNLLHKVCSNISYIIECDTLLDTFIFTYTIAGKKYTINIGNICDIKTDKEAQDLVTMIRENINYHLREQETNKNENTR